MIRKKSKFFTFIFSMMFGAGHMYMGFMKEGISITTAAAIVIFTGSWLNIGPVLYVLPVLWCYSFFDALNKRSMPDELFQTLEDHYLFIENYDRNQLNKLLSKHSNSIAALLIIVGFSILGENFLSYIADIVDTSFGDRFYSFVNSLRWDLPRLIFSGIIIYIGVRLIVGKKKELYEYDDAIVHTTELKNNFSIDDYIIKEQDSNENS